MLVAAWWDKTDGQPDRPTGALPTALLLLERKPAAMSQSFNDDRYTALIKTNAAAMNLNS